MTAWWNVSERRRDKATQQLAADLSARRAELRGHLVNAQRAAEAVDDALLDRLEDNAAELRDLIARVRAAEDAPWDPATWDDWYPDSTVSVPRLRIGEAVESGDGGRLGLPVTVPVVSTAGPVVLLSRNALEAQHATQLLQSLTVRAAACFPKQARFALLDPARKGATFPFSRRLDQVLLGFEEQDRALAELLGDATRIETSVLDRWFTTFDDVPMHRRLAERRQFVMVESFPGAYAPADVAAIRELCERGPRCGIHPIIHLEAGAGEAALAELAAPWFATAQVIQLESCPIAFAGIEALVEFDPAPSHGCAEMVFQRVATLPRRDRPLPWAELARPEAAIWADGPSRSRAVPVGRAGGDAPFPLVIGRDLDPTAASNHAVVVGSPAGRRHVLDPWLLGLVQASGPTQLTLRLIELGDDGCLEPWRRVPHTRLAALGATTGQAVRALDSVLAEIDRHRSDDMADRDTMTIVVIDGLDEALGDPAAGEVVDRLARVLADGPAAGVHVIVGVGRFDRSAALLGEPIFDRFDLRVTSSPDRHDGIQAHQLGPQGRRLVDRVCDRPGRAVVNSLRGHDEANVALHVATVSATERDEAIRALVHRARIEYPTLLPAFVLNGPDQPQLADNPHLARLVDAGSCRTPAVVADVARAAARGPVDWIAEERPRLIVVGQPHEAQGSAHFVLRRRPTENVAIVMGSRELRAGALTGLLVSAVLSDHPTTLEVWFADRSAATDPFGASASTTLDQLARLGSRVHTATDAEGAAQYITTLSAEVQRRRELPEDRQVDLTTTLLVLGEPDRIPLLQRVPTATGVADSPIGLDLRYVLVQGPAVGVHVVLLARGLGSIRPILADSVLHQDFRHRIVARASEEDSFVLVRSGRAASLADESTGSAAAVLFDAHSQSWSTFAPYSSGGTDESRAGTMRTQALALLGRVEEQLSS